MSCGAVQCSADVAVDMEISTGCELLVIKVWFGFGNWEAQALRTAPLD
jgi:hypothetical protein